MFITGNIISIIGCALAFPGMLIAALGQLLIDEADDRKALVRVLKAKGYRNAK